MAVDGSATASRSGANCRDNADRYPIPDAQGIRRIERIGDVAESDKRLAINQAGPFIIVVVRADTPLPPARASELCAAFVRHFRDRGYEVNRGQLIVDRSRARETDCKVTG